MIKDYRGCEIKGIREIVKYGLSMPKYKPYVQKVLDILWKQPILREEWETFKTNEENSKSINQLYDSIFRKKVNPNYKPRKNRYENIPKELYEKTEKRVDWFLNNFYYQENRFKVGMCEYKFETEFEIKGKMDYITPDWIYENKFCPFSFFQFKEKGHRTKPYIEKGKHTNERIYRGWLTSIFYLIMIRKYQNPRTKGIKLVNMNFGEILILTWNNLEKVLDTNKLWEEMVKDYFAKREEAIPDLYYELKNYEKEI